MSTVEEHKIKFHHNRDLISHLNGTKFRDWQITACFYAALHYIQSCLHSKKNISDDVFSSHTETKAIIRQNFPQILCDYTSLLELSYTSRYQSLNDILSDDVNEAEKYLQNIVDECDSFSKQKTLV